MNAATRRALAIYELVAGSRGRRCLRQTHTQLDQLSACEDAEIADRCRRLIEVPKLPDAEQDGDPFKWLLGRDLGDRDAEMLAVAAEAFARFPPEPLAPGSRLFEQQLLAAVHCLRGALVQMDTGEGKTFALATAAMALLHTHPKVYIATANPYLAARDAVNTAPFWDAVGVSVGIAVEGEDNPEPWRARVVYTTLESLVFRSLQEDLGETPRLLQWSALLIDEADAILLDDSGRQFTISRTTDDPTKDWTAALRIASQLEDDDLQVRSAYGLSAQLTASGEAAVAELGALEEIRPVDRLAVLRDVEQAYIALRVARTGHDYEVQDDAVVTLDPNSGWHTPGVRYSWVSPLEAHLGLRRLPRRSLLHFTDGIAILRRFRHVAGASGTIIEEALEYAMLLSLPPAVIPPRKPRRDGRLPDVIAVSRDRAHEWVVDEIERIGADRPVLVATDSTVEAQQIAQRLTAKKVPGVEVHLVNDETIAAERTFERAGQPGVTIVSTRVSGRGVDIQLSPEARAAGGAALIAVGHSPQVRVDRQLLGRVGRQGDPYSARFVNHPDDPLMGSGAINRRWIETILQKMTIDGVLEAGIFPRQLAGAQRRVRRWHLQSFAGSVGQGLAREEATGLLRRWRQSLGTKEQGERVSDEFAGFLTERFLETNYPALSERQIGGPLIRAVAEKLVDTAGGTKADALDLIGKATGLPAEGVRKVFLAYLQEVLLAADGENEKARKGYARRQRATEEAAMRARLRRLVENLDAGNNDGLDARRMLRAALAAADDTAAVPASGAGLAAMTEEMQHAVEEGAYDGLRTLAAAMPAPPVGEFDPRLATWKSRSSWEIASETIHRGSRQLENGLERAQFRVNQMANSARSAVAFKLEIENLRQEVEATLAADLCDNLILGRDPSTLNELFAEAEHAVAVSRPRVEIALPSLPARRAGPGDFVEPPVPQGADALIAEYATAVREALPKEPREEGLLVTALKELIGSAGIAPLGNPDVVAERYGAWKRSDRRWKELPPWRWRFADRYVRGFLVFLKERGLAATLPAGIPQRSRSLGRRAWKKLGTPALGLGALALSGAIMVALVLALLPPAQGLELGTGPTFLDRLLTAGLLANGSALAPALLALTGGLWARLLRGVPANGDSGVSGIEQEASSALVALGAVVVLAPWSQGSPLGFAVSLPLAVTLAVACFLVRNGTYRFEQITHFHLITLLAAGLATFSALPLLVDLSSASLVLPIAAAAAAINLLSRPLRRARVPALALRIDDEAPSERESLEVMLPIAGRLSVVHHAFALAFAWTFSCVLVDGDAATRTAVGSVAYLATLTAWALILARSVTNPSDWQKRMRANQQTYRQPDSESNLNDALDATRRRVFAAELASACVLVGLGAWLTANAPDALLAQLPLGMATIFLAVTVTDMGGTFVRGLAATAVTTTGGLDLASEDEGDGMATKIRALVGQCTKWMSGVIAAILALHELADLVGLGEFLVNAYESLRNLL